MAFRTIDLNVPESTSTGTAIDVSGLANKWVVVTGMTGGTTVDVEVSFDGGTTWASGIAAALTDATPAQVSSPATNMRTNVTFVSGTLAGFLRAEPEHQRRA